MTLSTAYEMSIVRRWAALSASAAGNTLGAFKPAQAPGFSTPNAKAPPRRLDQCPPVCCPREPPASPRSGSRPLNGW